MQKSLKLARKLWTLYGSLPRPHRRRVHLYPWCLRKSWLVRQLCCMRSWIDWLIDERWQDSIAEFVALKRKSSGERPGSIDEDSGSKVLTPRNKLRLIIECGTHITDISKPAFHDYQDGGSPKEVGAPRDLSVPTSLEVPHRGLGVNSGWKLGGDTPTIPEGNRCTRSSLG